MSWRRLVGWLALWLAITGVLGQAGCTGPTVEGVRQELAVRGTARVVARQTAAAAGDPTAMLGQRAHEQLRNRFVEARIADRDAVVVSRLAAPGWTQSNNTAVRTVADDFKQFAPKAFSIEGIDHLTFISRSSYTNSRGVSYEDDMMKLTINRAAAEGIDWSNVDPRDFARLLRGDDGSFYVDPSFARHWIEYAAGR